MERFGEIVLFFVAISVLCGGPYLMGHKQGFQSGKIEGQNWVWEEYTKPCEIALPRTQECKLIAVPENNDDKRN